MEAPTLAELTAAAVNITVNGKPYEVKPISVSIIGSWLERLAQRRVDGLPSMAELLQGMKGHETDAVSDAIKTLYYMHQDANNPSLDDLLSWMVNNPVNIFSVIADCVKGDVDRDDLFQAVLGELKNKSDFANRWLAASGLAGNPT